MRALGCACLVAALLAAPGALRAADQPETDAALPRVGPLFFGYETEPCMDFGGKTIASLHAGFCDLGALLIRRKPALAAAFEIPAAVVFSTLQHEVNGHGGRAREYGLHPSYGFGFDFSAYTTIRDDPETNEQMLYLAMGGTESSSVLAHRLFRDLCRPAGTKASLIPLMIWSKLDVSLYAFMTSKPDADSSDDSFTDQYEEGNDIAIYLVSRQAQRRDVNPADVWNRDYSPDLSDPWLKDNWRDVQAMAVWNLLDPSMFAAAYLYGVEHLRGGRAVARPPLLPLNDSLAFTIGTRGAIGPQSVTRFLDFYLLSHLGLAHLYARDLRASSHTAYGFGGGLHAIPIARFLSLSGLLDHWTHPDAEEALYDGDGWNAALEIETAFAQHYAFTLKVGWKSEGFIPGAPTDNGAYVGAGFQFGF